MSETVKKIGKLKLIYSTPSKTEFEGYLLTNYDLKGEETKSLKYLIEHIKYVLNESIIFIEVNNYFYLFEMTNNENFQELCETIIVKNEDNTYNFTCIFNTNQNYLEECLEYKMQNILELKNDN